MHVRALPPVVSAMQIFGLHNRPDRRLGGQTWRLAAAPIPGQECCTATSARLLVEQLLGPTCH